VGEAFHTGRSRAEFIGERLEPMRCFLDLLVSVLHVITSSSNGLGNGRSNGMGGLILAQWTQQLQTP
jgi:hypothetical protein